MNTMTTITIDDSLYVARHGSAPRRGAFATWTFIIEDLPLTVFGTYEDAVSSAKLYARLCGEGPTVVRLSAGVPAGRMHRNHH